MNSPSRAFNYIDLFFLSCFVVLITLQPFFLHGEIIMMETGIHLPALNAMFHGAMPYRDFFYLRGPFELYVPAFMMSVFGKNMAMLPIFYYVGTVLTLLVCLFIAMNIYRTRLFLYLAIPVLVARTFPRVSYNYWGGMRYALGLLAVFFAILYFKKQKRSWIFWAGVASALSFLTTVEAGLSVMLAILGTLFLSYLLNIQDRRALIRAGAVYLFGISLLIVPFTVYFQASGALAPFLETTWMVATNLTKTFIDAPGNHPESIGQFFLALSPFSPYFKFMTPVFFYVLFFIFIIWRIKKDRLGSGAPALICLAIYGIILYIAAFRKIEGYHFEMALQPEKLLYFFIAEEIFFFLKRYKEKTLKFLRTSARKHGQWERILKACSINLLFFALVVSSIGYSIARYNNRFPAFQLTRNFLCGQSKDLSPLAREPHVMLKMKRVQGLTVPSWQAEELKGVTDFLENNTTSDEIVFAYPELGDFNFLADRPFLGKFPIVTFSWINDSWSNELIEQLQIAKPRYIVMTKIGHRTFPEKWYFRNPNNRRYFDQVTKFVLASYVPVKAFSSVEIYKLRKD